MTYMTNTELADAMTCIILKLHEQSDRDLLNKVAERLESLDSHLGFMRNRISTCEHIVGQLYIDNYENCM